MRKIAPDDATEGYVVLAQALPTAETPFLEVRDGSIEIYAEDPCPIWRVRISKMHKDGFKYIYFSKTLPDGAKKFNVRDFETPPAAEQSMEFVI